MIAITDTSSFTGLDLNPPTPTVDLTAAIINVKLTGLTGGIIKNAAITTAVKKMLLSIVGNTNVTATTKSKIATYSGFKVNGNVVDFDGDDASLDKLTFYVIFRLPYSNPESNLTYEDIADGDISSVDPVAGANTWGKYANYIRTMTGSGLKKINSAGEQVNNSGIPIDDNGNSLTDGTSDTDEKWYNEHAYTYLGLDPFSGIPTSDIPPLCLYPSIERAMLFGQNNASGPNGTDPVLPITKIPIYFFLLAKKENPYSKNFWLKTNLSEATRAPHWPANFSTKKYRRHFVKTNSTLSIPNDTYTLISNTSGTYFLLPQTGAPDAKIFIEVIDTDALSFEGLTLSAADQVEKNGEGLIAIWLEKYSNPVMTNSSGLTIGMGLDIGAAFATSWVYDIKFNITFTGTGTFRLYYADKRTAELSTATLTCNSLKIAIFNLLGIVEGKYIKVDISVKDSAGNLTGTPNKIAIQRKVDKNDNAYNHKIYVHNVSSGLTVNINPALEANRWIENTLGINDSLFYINRVLSHSFANNPGTNDYWLDQLGLTQNEKDKIVYLLKKSVGCRSKAGYHIFDENRSILKKIELKSYVRNLRAVYHKFFKDRYYNRKREVDSGPNLTNYALDYPIKNLLEKSSLKTKPNQAELFAIALLNFNDPQTFANRTSDLIKAINKHSITELIATISSSRDRQTALREFILGTTAAPSPVKIKLYHGLDD